MPPATQIAVNPEVSADLYEQLNLEVLNPACPFFPHISEALSFLGEFEGADHFIHPKAHPMAREITASPDIARLNELIALWIERYELPGLKPFDHGSASIVLDAGQSFVIKICSTEKQSPPPIPIVSQPQEIAIHGGFRFELVEKLAIGPIPPAELHRLEQEAEARGYFIDDHYCRNFGVDPSGVWKICDSDAVKLKLG